MRCRELLDAVRAKGLRPKKSLGQNFLINDAVIERIVDAARLSGKETVLEVGGGHGALTLALAPRCKELIVVEKDPILARHLSEIAPPNVTVLEEDVLKIDLKPLLPPGSVVVSNLPYSISSPFMFKLWDEGDAVERFVLMFQKEVAERIAASHGTREYGVLSVLFSLTFHVKVLFKVSKNSFWPRPEVDSAVIEGRRRQRMSAELKAALRKVLDAAFPYRRKKLVKALGMGLPGVDWERVLDEVGIPHHIRPDALEPEGWLAIAKSYKNLLI